MVKVTKQKMLNELLEFLYSRAFNSSEWRKDLIQNRVFKYGMKKSKKELVSIYNLYNYSYYNYKPIQLYWDITG